MQPLIDEVLANHDCRPGASLAEITAAETRIGFPLPTELRSVLTAANGAVIWPEGDIPSRLLSAADLQHAGLALDADGAGPRGLITVVENESDFAALDLDPQSASYGLAVDCSHETYPYELGVVCESFEHLLRLMLESEGQEWLWPAVIRTGRNLAE